jgi:hypothetical protein
LVQSGPVVVEDVALSVNWIPISANAIVLSFLAKNSRDTLATVDIGIRAEISLDTSFYYQGYSASNAPIRVIDGGHGFAFSSPEDIVTFITTDYPLVDNTSTYWFGQYPYGDTSYMWTQTSDSAYSGGYTGMAFSWKGVIVPGGGSVTRTCIVRSGPYESSHVILLLAFPSPASVHYLDTITILGIAWAVPPPTGTSVRLLLVIDENKSGLTDVGGLFVLGEQFAFAFNPADHSLQPGMHTLDFYAVDSDGDVSEPQSVTITLTNIPVPTPELPVLVIPTTVPPATNDLTTKPPSAELLTTTEPSKVVADSAGSAGGGTSGEDGPTWTATESLATESLATREEPKVPEAPEMPELTKALTSDTSSSSNAAVIVGAVIGSVIGVGAIVGGVVLILWFRKKPEKESDGIDGEELDVSNV